MNTDKIAIEILDDLIRDCTSLKELVQDEEISPERAIVQLRKVINDGNVDVILTLNTWRVL